ncbi:MAG: beta-N-acetylhexosaminidase [Bacteroidales bacterium]|nr:beta-N-acetylhexosaminidase [Bacteroidales bacterium]
MRLCKRDHNGTTETLEDVTNCGFVRHWSLLMSLTVVLLFVSCGKNVIIDEYSIIPQPVEITMDKGEFTLSSSTKCYAGNVGQNDPSIKYISRLLRQWHLNPVLVGKPETNCLQFIINDTFDQELGDEGYSIDINKDMVKVSANSERGLFYGFQTFVQMLPEDISRVRYSKIVLPACHLKDYPRFGWRGSHLDVSRHFMGVSQVKKHLDLMAMYKMNKFHWHLTDDHGWRIEISKYPLLNDVGSWRVDRDDQPWGEADPPEPGEQRTNGGYYTKDEIKEIVTYAAERYIDIIPEIEIPGHCCAVLESYPELGCMGDDTTYTVQFGPYWPPRAILCAGNDSVMSFLKDVMDEIIPLFPGSYIHIGGDEAVKYNWERCPRCSQRMKSLGLKNYEQLQGWMIVEIEKYVKLQGKNIIGWDEILEGGVSPDATVMSWQGTSGGIVAARKGNDVIMTPTDFCYFNYYQANPEFQPPAMLNTIVTLHKVYGYNPMPAGLSEAQQKHILGAQCNLWTEYINTPEMAEYMLLPRLCAMSEVLWSPDASKSWDGFRHRVASHRLRLEANDYIVGSGSFQPWLSSEKSSDGRVLVTIHWEREGTHVYYHTGDGHYSLYTEPFYVDSGTKVTTLSFFNGIIREKAYDYVIK